VRGLFDSIVGGDRAERPKPYPDLMLVALRELGAAPNETLLVGDGDHDIRMGASAGARTCGVGWGVHAAERLHAAGAEFVVQSVAELRELILPTMGRASAQVIVPRQPTTNIARTGASSR
jgi:phosphoglycolate phosphatase-like HAD superfamily hydrolase